MTTPMKFKSYIDELKERIKKEEQKQQEYTKKEEQRQQELTDKINKDKEQAEKDKLRQQEQMDKTKKERLALLYHFENQPSESEIIEMAKKEENKCFMALLLASNSFETLFGSEIKNYFDNAEITSLVRTYSLSELKAKSESHDKYFEVYMKD